jgi:CHAT domain-containing protein
LEAGDVHTKLRVRHKTAYLSYSEATKPAVVEAMRMCEIVHLATHGAPDGVFLSGPTADEGMLTMAEVQALELPRAMLVVLSECDSFRGELKADGVIGITRAFVAAGSPTLVASLWQVSDHSTRVLFYDALLGEAAGDAAVALQTAMVSMLREGFAVMGWAAFVVYGLASV